jgi:hypothetical protein
VFAHVATYTPSREVDQISSEPRRGRPRRNFDQFS